MSYDTDHVRNAGTRPETIVGIQVFTELVDNPDLASLYTVIRETGPATSPELVETATVSKKTVYEYLRKLEQAGLITDEGCDGGAKRYRAEPFELTLTVRDTEVSITPAIIETLAHTDEYPVIDRVLGEHGIVALALAYDLVVAHSDGDVTIRQIASLTALSSGTTYDLIDAIYTIADLGDESGPTTYTPETVEANVSDSLGSSTDDR